MELTVLGAGYVGLTTAACLARLGHSVTVYEADARRAEALAAGEVPFYEPGLDDLVLEGMREGRLTVAKSSESVLTVADLVLVCVGTPLNDVGDADLSQVRAACSAITAYSPGACVVIRSTLPLGETESVLSWLGPGGAARVATNPEFLRQGSAVADFLSPTRIVIGTSDGERREVAERLLHVYAGIEAPVMVTDFNSAEMIKNAANAFLATKLSFINEVADLCEAYGADIAAVTTGMGLDPRIGASYLGAGIGFGGSCLPKELANMVRLARQRGLENPLMTGAAQTNERRTARVADRIEEVAGPIHGQRVALLGLAFKPDTDDLRYSPALSLGLTLVDRGATVAAHDPAVPASRTGDMPALERARDVEAAITGADLVVLATEWPEYLALDWAAMARLSKRALVFDGRNALSVEALRDAGWSIVQVGRPPS